LAESLVLAGSYAASRRKEPAPDAGPHFTIALSREVGAGGTSVGAAVGERLGWPVYDHELIERIAAQMHLRTSLLESVDERRRSWLLEAVEAFSSGRTVSESAYVRHLVETVLSLGTHGDCVIVGRGAALVLPPATTLRVRLIAEMEDRIRNMSRERGLSHQDAANLIDALDRERVRFSRDHFRKDVTDPSQYDLVLNTSRVSYAACADIVMAALRHLRERAAEKQGGRQSS
jgi:cytidylate kinase